MSIRRGRCDKDSGKFIYPTEQTAKDALSRFAELRAAGQMHRKETRAYLCKPDLDHWHVSSKRRTDEKRVGPTQTPSPRVKGPAQTPPSRIKGPAADYWQPDELDLLHQDFTIDDIAQLTGRSFAAVVRKLSRLERDGELIGVIDAPLGIAQYRAIGRDWQLTGSECAYLGRMEPYAQQD